MRRATLAAAVVLATAACGSSSTTPGPVAYEHDHHQAPRPQAQDPTAGLPYSLAAARPVLQRASRNATRTRPATTAGPNTTPGGNGLTVTSTAYCEHGVTASGAHTGPGSVAMNGVPFGSRWRVDETDAEYVVTDRIGHGSDFDIWLDSCADARAYGRRTIHVERVA